MRSLTNLNFIVTGATSGIGKALVLALLEQGANVAFCGRSPEKLQQLDDELTRAYPLARTFSSSFDLTESPRIADFVAQATATLGEPDVLINNAGVNSARGGVSELALADLDWMVKVNMYAPLNFIQSVVNSSMRTRHQGMIINIMSTVCQFANEGIGAYTASKSGFDGLTKVLRKELRDEGIKVCNIYPGGVDTPFREASRPLYLSAEQVVDAVLHVAGQSENASIDDLTIRPMVEKNFP